MTTQALEPVRVMKASRPKMARQASAGTWAAMIPCAAAAGALALHEFLPSQQTSMATGSLYARLLQTIIVLALASTALQAVWIPSRRWIRLNAPLLTAGIFLLCAWDLITLKFAWMPLPYFPGPDMVLRGLVDERQALFTNAMASLTLLVAGYAIGAAAGLFSGVSMGWSPRVRYWGMPALKLIGPLPATALIPLAMALFTSSFFSGAALIALAVWFPVTMLTASGVSNVRVSYLDVARTLGAGRRYLIFRVALPAAMPSIFIGLFMGLGAAFLTLIAAETVGVSAGLGYYLRWRQAYAEYDKVYAALLVMAVFFSAVMTLLFKLRDRVLVWQKGVIKW